MPLVIRPKIMARYEEAAAALDDCCRLVLSYNAVHSIQQTKQISNDPPKMGAKNTTTSNHPSTPCLFEIMASGLYVSRGGETHK